VALTTCVVYLLNGYYTANISSNTNQAYLYFPIVLFGILSFCKRPSVNSYLLTIFGYALAFTVTFFPSTVLMATSACVVAAGAAFHFQANWKKSLKILAIQATAPAIAILSLSFLYLPLIEAMKFVSAMEVYSLRQFYPASIKGIISLFSAKHVFELHNAMHPDYAKVVGNEIFHFGIITGCVSAIAIFSRQWFKNILWASFSILLIVSLGRIFDLPGISQLVNHLPFFRNIAEQYWWIMVACSFPIVFAYGLHRVEMAAYRLWPAILIALVVLVDLNYILNNYGIVNTDNTQYATYRETITYIITTVTVTVLSVLALVAIRKMPHRRAFLVTLLCFSVFLEMNYYFNTARYTRTEMFKNPPDYVLFLKKNLGLNRLASYGSVGIPPEVGTAYQLQQIEFFTMNIFPSYYNLCQRDLTTEHGWWGKDTFCVNRDTKSEPNVNLNTLEMLSVKYLVVSKNMPQFMDYFNKNHLPQVFESPTVIIFENTNAYPRSYGVDNLYLAPKTPDTQKQSARNVAFTEDQKLLEEAALKKIHLGLPNTEATSSAPEPAIIETFENTKVSIRTNFTAPKILVLPDNWHPNWKATVNGEPVYIGKVNESFRGIALGGGNQLVEMSYSPRSLPLALGITSVVISALACLFCMRRKIENLFNS
jgi:hypothetical protein